MKSNPKGHHRRSIRVGGFDYASEGGYFVTICTHDKLCLFGEIIDEAMKLSDAGEVAKQCWLQLPEHFSRVEVDEFVVMPNHVHGIILLWNDNYLKSQSLKEKPGRGLMNQTPTEKWILMKNPKQTLGKIIRHYKAKSAKIIHNAGYLEFKWQRGYYEHIIRSENDLNRIRQYIHDNVLKWSYDDENPNRHS